MGNQQHNQMNKYPKIFKSFGALAEMLRYRIDQKHIQSQFAKNYVNNLQQNLANGHHDKLFGCLFGCLIGDALGAYCEFQEARLTEKKLQETMEMRGGGTFKLWPGQFTDDSQMAYHLLIGLSKLKINSSLTQQREFLLKSIAQQYVIWNRSNPFDIGITCRKGIEVLDRGISLNQSIEEMIQNVKNANHKSQSNGSLMRIAPMALLFALTGQQPQRHTKFIEDEIRLLHPNQNLIAAGRIWVCVLVDLIRRNDNSSETFRNIFAKAEEKNQNTDISAWFQQSKQPEKMPAIDKMGWAKIAWTYGMNVLFRLANNKLSIQDLNYELELKNVIKEAGDSDTNAAIVGGMIGSIIGFKALPLRYLSITMQLKLPQQQERRYTIDRPKCYEPYNVLCELAEFVEICNNYKQHQKYANSPKI